MRARLLLLAVSAAVLSAILAAVAVAVPHPPGFDRTYGEDGVVKVPLPFPAPPGSSQEVAPWINVKAFSAAGDGDAYVLGKGGDGTCPAGRCGEREFLFRFDIHGKRDLTYGGDGRLILPTAHGSLTVLADVRARAVVGAIEGGEIVLRRFTLRGRPDPGFGDGGVVRIPCDCSTASLRLFQTPGYRILVDANSPVRRGARYDGATAVRLTRLDKHGRIDRGYGRRGTVRFTIPRPGPLKAVAPTLGGALLLGGSRHGGPGQIYLWRVSAAGRVDHSFVSHAARSVRRLNALGEFPGLSAIVPRQDGTVAAIGTSQQRHGFYLRLRRDGRLAAGFADHGVLRLPFTVETAVGGLRGAVFAVGTVGGSYDYKAFRILAGGGLDPVYAGAKGIRVPLQGVRIHAASEGSGRVLVTDEGNFFCRYACPSEPGMVRFRE